jgi:Ni/Fe-hydrogenase subunit HybB-like protein
MKPAILIAFLGYGSSCLALLFDIGLPHRFWHPLFMWNETSFLFEVFWCVVLYFTVTVIEISPTFLDKVGMSSSARFLHKIAGGIVLLGISLSCLHHSSLGSLFLVTPQRLHALWYSPLLPVFFFTSAVGAGLMVVVLARVVCTRWYDPDSVSEPVPAELSASMCSVDGTTVDKTPESIRARDLPMLTGIATIACCVLSLYLVVKLIDLFASGDWNVFLRGEWECYLFGIELVISVLIPVTLVAIPRTRYSPTWLGTAAFSAALGLALNRLDVGIFGYFRDARAVYFPSLLEWALSLGVIAGAILVFMLCVEYFPFFGRAFKEQPNVLGGTKGVFGNVLRTPDLVLRGGLYRLTLIAVFVIPLAWLVLYPPYTQSQAPDFLIKPSLGLDDLRATLKIDGNRGGVFTVFPHSEHQDRLGGESSCGNCHHISLPGDKSTPCSRCHRDLIEETLIFDHTLHLRTVAAEEELSGWHPENHSCRECHIGTEPKSQTSAKPCLECHESDMAVRSEIEFDSDLRYAPGFEYAMHETCISCHETEARKLNRAGLAECSNCHRTLRPRSDASHMVWSGVRIFPREAQNGHRKTDFRATR